jgi:nicotinamidase-related amidase
MLLFVDVQRNMLEPPAPVPAAGPVSAALATLLERARAAGAPVIHIRNNGSEVDPDLPGSPGWELVHQPLDGEPVIDKFTPDSFAGTGLADLVPPSSTLVIAGMQSDWCIRATSLAALKLGHQVRLVRGAHATYDGDRPAQAISDSVESELAAAGAVIVELDDVTF